MNKLGFGFLRLPKNKKNEYDFETTSLLVDCFIKAGRRYFDTCYTYLGGNSELGIKKCLTSRYPRDAYELADKLPGYQCKSYEDCWRYFKEQQQRCGVEWFDVYMLHWLNKENYQKAQRVDEFCFLRELKEKGLAKRIGFSYHDSASLLDEILTDHPEVDVVLLQLNYLDWESAGIESKKCYETCIKHHKSVMAMEPVKGGTLAKLPSEAEKLLRDFHPDWSNAKWALSFVQSLPGVEVVLSGMNSMEQMLDNIKEIEPLTTKEINLLNQVCQIIESNTAVSCTGCRYCEIHCPMHLAIPDYMKLYNEISRFPADDWKIIPTYRQMTLTHGKAGQCISCHACMKHCPQRIDISNTMKKISSIFD